MACMERCSSERSDGTESLSAAQRLFLASCRHNSPAGPQPDSFPVTGIPEYWRRNISSESQTGFKGDTAAATRKVPSASLIVKPPAASARAPHIHTLYSPVKGHNVDYAPSPPSLAARVVSPARIASPRKMKFKQLTVNPVVSPQPPQCKRSVKSCTQDDTSSCTFFAIEGRRPYHFSPLRKNRTNPPDAPERHSRLPPNWD